MKWHLLLAKKIFLKSMSRLQFCCHFRFSKRKFQCLVPYLNEMMYFKNITVTTLFLIAKYLGLFSNTLFPSINLSCLFNIGIISFYQGIILDYNLVLCNFEESLFQFYPTSRKYFCIFYKKNTNFFFSLL